MASRTVLVACVVGGALGLYLCALAILGASTDHLERDGGPPAHVDSGSASSPSGAHPPLAPGRSVDRVSRASGISERSDVAEGLPLVGSIGEAFWGARWTEMKPKLAERINLESPMDIALPPWPEIQPQVCSMLKCEEAHLHQMAATHLIPRELTVDYVAARFQLPAGSVVNSVHLAAISSLLADVHTAGEVALADFQSAVDRALALKCAAGKYDYMPIANIENVHTPKDAIFSTSFAISGWVVSCGLGPEEAPEVEAARHALTASRRRGMEVIAGYLRSLR